MVTSHMGILAVIVLTCLAGTAAVLAAPASWVRAQRMAALSAAGLALVFSCAALAMYPLAEGGLRFSEQHRLAANLPLVFTFSADGLGLLALVMANLMGLLTLLFPFDAGARHKEYCFWLMAAQTAACGMLCSGDIYNFCGYWLFAPVPLYFLAALWGARDRERAALKFFARQLAWGGAFLAALWALGQAGLVPASALRFKILAAALMLAAVFSRLAAVPFHLWARDFFTQVPGHIAAFAAGVGGMCALYAVARFIIPAAREGFTAAAPYVMAAAVLGAVYASLLAMAQKNLKAVAGCMTMAAAGLSLCGAVSLNSIGLTGGGLALLGFPAAAALLFFLAEIFGRRFPSLLVDEVHGLMEVMPGFSFILLFALGSLAVVPVSGVFIAGFMLLAGMLKVCVWCAVLALAAMLFLSVVVVRLTAVAIWGKYAQDLPPAALTGHEIAVLIPLPAVLLGLLIYPAPALDYINTAVALAQTALLNL